MPVSVLHEVRHRHPSRYDRGAPTRRPSRLWRPLIDAVAAGAVFALVTTLLVAPVKAGPYPAAFAGLDYATRPAVTKALAEPGPRPVVEIATASTPGDAVYRGTSTTAAWGLLGVAFSLLAALDLAVLRHVKRVYAPRFAPARKRTTINGRCGGTRY